jgi:hypothetical protein
MSGIIYLIGSNNELVEMHERSYDSEDVLQTLLAKYPSLLAGEQIDQNEPRRWLLVSREVGIPWQEEGGARWSLDHLFLDQDGIPTIVEVKRSNDTRIRREVVGQMLDYAANAVAYWPVESLKALLEKRFEIEGGDVSELFTELLGPEADIEAFWLQVKTNLQAGKIRLVFVADEIATELRRIVEFLNKQMDPAEVLAVEVKQYAGQELKTLVPRVIGRAVETHKTREGKQWDEQTFISTLESRWGAQEASIAKDILNWAHDRKLRIWWGKGAQDASYMPLFDYEGETHWLIAVWTHARVAIQYGMIKGKQPFDSEEKRLELLNRLNAIPGVSISQEGIERYPSFRLSALKNRKHLNEFLNILDWMISEIKLAVSGNE